MPYDVHNVIPWWKDLYSWVLSLTQVIYNPLRGVYKILWLYVRFSSKIVVYKRIFNNKSERGDENIFA